MIRKMTQLFVPAVILAGLAFTAPSAHAATLTEGVFHIVGSANGPASDTQFKVSVYPGSEGFAGVGNVGSTAVPVDETFNNPIVDYRFFTDAGISSDVAFTYASGGGGLISDLSPLLFSTGYFGSPDIGKVWETTDPGTGYVNPADFDANTMLGNTTTVDGSVDISSLDSGSLYFLYGGYRTWNYFDITMSDTDGPAADLVLTDVGDNDYSNNNEFYVYSVDFVNDAGYDTIGYHYDNSGVDNGRFVGVVVTAPTTIPEPSTFALAALGFLGLLFTGCRRRKR